MLWAADTLLEEISVRSASLDTEGPGTDWFILDVDGLGLSRANAGVSLRFFDIKHVKQKQVK